MRSQILLVVALLFSVVVNAQTGNSRELVLDNGGTTQEEYNYLTKGYKIAKESGMDLKRGYKLMDLDYFDKVAPEVKYFKVWFKAFVREKDNSIAATFIIIYNPYYGSSKYLCLPRNNDELRKSFDNIVRYKLTENERTAVLLALSQFASKKMNDVWNLGKDKM